jgi:hypothetical protein
MPRFPKSLAAWQSDAFARTLKDEIEAMEAAVLPLDEGIAQGGLVADASITAIFLASTDDGHSIVAKVGVFFTEITAGCSCGDEPDEMDTYCRLQILIDKTSA